MFPVAGFALVLFEQGHPESGHRLIDRPIRFLFAEFEKSRLLQELDGLERQPQSQESDRHRFGSHFPRLPRSRRQIKAHPFHVPGAAPALRRSASRAGLFVDQLLHQIHLDLLNLQELFPLMFEQDVEFFVQVTNFQLRL